MQKTAVIYEGTVGSKLETTSLTVVGVDHSGLVGEALRLAEAGWERIELCGGVGVETSAEVRDALPGHVRIGLNRYGFESLELVADYKRAFAEGDERPAAFLVPADAGVDRAEHPGVSIIGVTSPEHTAEVAAGLAEAGIGLIELYAGLGTEHAAAAVRGSGGRVPVGFVGYDD
ncbi:hypothetical protein E1281_27785 [Actinomadura sp. KC345]|uniref:DUF6506 family protein n=1 Tax=Actinomadura sp. KC345 TaxID=2530371 RepID=UPI00104884AF|nr:DUF6506 family protein [Actinomadura sp. KC345]TDC46547.1 hypothetical protein E1281_27785 [Actinomadura sp. KC345]